MRAAVCMSPALYPAGRGACLRGFPGGYRSKTLHSNAAAQSRGFLPTTNNESLSGLLYHHIQSLKLTLLTQISKKFNHPSPFSTVGMNQSQFLTVNTAKIKTNHHAAKRPTNIIKSHSRNGPTANANHPTLNAIRNRTSDSKINHQKNHEEVICWVKQALKDYKALTRLHTAEEDYYSYVCFMAHEVAEKALKGAIHALCGLDKSGLSNHELRRHALVLIDKGIAPSNLYSRHCEPLEKYYLDTRFPNRWKSDDIPSSHYTHQQASEAKDHAKAILDVVTIILNQKEE